MRALERNRDVKAAAAHWRALFGESAEDIGTMHGRKVWWHEAFGIWGVFGKKTHAGRTGDDWNAFGQKPTSTRANIIVEINYPRSGIDQNIQGLFGIDAQGKRWILHQGRLSVRPTNVTEADFIAATGLKPTEVQFADGSTGKYHLVAPIDVQATIMLKHLAAFVARCAIARLAKKAPDGVVKGFKKAQDWEGGLNPEATGTFDIAGTGPRRGRRRHGEVWRALAAELKSRNIQHSNDRVGQYGPDMFTFGPGPQVLFEIKSKATAGDIFGGIGQLQIYERLLGRAYKKVLMVPSGMGKMLKAPISDLKIHIVEYERDGAKIAFEQTALGNVLVD